MRFAVLSYGEVCQFLYGDVKISGAVSSSGYIRDESYDRHIYNDISVGQGYNMYNKAVGVFDRPKTYAFIGHQCDDVTRAIMIAGDKGYGWQLAPNVSFENFSASNSLPAYFIQEKRFYQYISFNGDGGFWNPR